MPVKGTGARRRRDPYAGLGGGLVLLDWMHRVILPRAGRDIEAVLAGHGACRVLDVACGTGYMACRLAAAGHFVCGLDLSGAMLRLAASKIGTCSFVKADGRRIPFKKVFDAAVVSLALHELSPRIREEIWAEMRRVVRPGGLLLALDFTSPSHRTPASIFFGAAIEAVEKGTLRMDPDHYPNSRRFRQAGGLSAWLATRGDRPAVERHYLGETVGLMGVVNP